MQLRARRRRPFRGKPTAAAPARLHSRALSVCALAARHRSASRHRCARVPPELVLWGKKTASVGAPAGEQMIMRTGMLLLTVLGAMLSLSVSVRTAHAYGAAAEPDGSDSTALAAVAVARPAFYILFEPMMRSAEWPTAYARYNGGTVVMNPFNVTHETVQRVKRELNATVLMYFDLADSQIKTPDGRCVRQDRSCRDGDETWKCSTGAMSCCSSIDCDAYANTTLCPQDAFSQSYQRVFPAKFAVNQVFADNASRVPQCLYSKGPLYVFSNRSVAALVPWLSATVRENGFDGLYMDQFYYGPSYGRALYESLLGNRGDYDTDGDGRADSVSAITAQAATWFPMFMQRLRRELGRDAVLLGNGNFAAGTVQGFRV